MLNQGCEMTPLEVLCTLDPVSRHEVHGSLEGALEALWEACDKFTPKHRWLDELALPKEVREALARLNKRAEETLNFYLSTGA